MIPVISQDAMRESARSGIACEVRFLRWAFKSCGRSAVVLSIVFGLLISWGLREVAVIRGKVAGVEPGSAQEELCSLETQGVYEYVGNKRCKMCHTQWFRSWQARPHGGATTALRPGISRAYKKRVGLNPDVDYMTNSKCLCCHTVGHGLPGGYRIPDPTDRKAQRLARHREGVGCESCHGPGSAYMAIMSEIDGSSREYKIEELRSKGLVKITASLCMSCHRQAAPCIEPTYKFDVRSLAGKSFHKRFKLEHPRK